VNVGVADIDGDGDDEIITAPGPGVPAHIKAFDIDDTIKHATEAASFIAGSVSDRGGADVSGAWRGLDDEAQAIVVASGPGGTGNVSLWNRFGQQQGASFKPYPGSTAGARVNSADIDGDGRDEIVTGPGAGGPPQVKTFASGPATLGANVGSMSFLAYPSGFTGGVDVGSFYESADVDVVSILTGAGPGGGPHVKRFDPPNHAEQPGWMAYDPGFAGGVHVDGGLLVFGGGSSTTTG
jgi:hypothetical protein